MNRRSLPPQAYTRGTLAKAFEWLKTQPEGFKSIATDADSLVTLYLQSRRSQQKQAPKSAQDFKNDLKNLAEGLKSFDDPEPVIAQPAPSTTASSSFTAPFIPDVEPLLDLTQPAQTPAPSQPAHQPVLTPQTVQAQPVTPTFTAPPKSTPKVKTAAVKNTSLELDIQSQMTLDEAKKRLNLSQDSEALRMLLVLGIERLRQVLPPQN